MIAWLDWTMLVLVKAGGVIWLSGCVWRTAITTFREFSEILKAETQ